MRDSATLLRSPLAHSATCARKRGRFFSSILLMVLVAALPGSLKAQQTERTPAAPLSVEDQTLIAQATRVFVEKNVKERADTLERTAAAPMKTAAAVLSCAFEHGDGHDHYWALSILVNRRDLQPIFLQQTIRLMDSKDSRWVWLSNHVAHSVPLAPDAISALGKFDPEVIKNQSALQTRLLGMVSDPADFSRAQRAASVWLNLYGENPRALQALEAGLDPQREIDERYDQFNLTYGSIRQWPERLTPPLVKLARSAPNMGRREQALRLLSRRQPEMAQAISREVLKTPRQDLMMVTAAFEILFPVEADSSTLFRQALERQRERVFPRTDGPPDEDFGAYSLRSSLLTSLKSKFGFAGMLDFLRKEFETASEGPSRASVVRLIENVSSNDIEERKQAAIWMRELAADVRVGPEDRKSLESVENRLVEPPRPPRGRGR